VPPRVRNVTDRGARHSGGHDCLPDLRRLVRDVDDALDQLACPLEIALEDATDGEVSADRADERIEIFDRLAARDGRLQMTPCRAVLPHARVGGSCLEPAGARGGRGGDEIAIAFK
jgi:hypothetical protein